MAEDPEARAKYEAELSSISDSWRHAYNLRYPGNGRRVYQEYFIISDGNVCMMSVSKSGGAVKDPVTAKRDKDDEEGWLEKLLKSIEEKTKKQMEKAMKAEDKEAAVVPPKVSARGHLDVIA